MISRSLGVSVTLHVTGDTGTSSFPMPERDKAVVMLDGGGAHASVITDRAGIDLLVSALIRARVELDQAQDAMAAEIAAGLSAAVAARQVRGAA